MNKTLVAIYAASTLIVSAAFAQTSSTTVPAAPSAGTSTETAATVAAPVKKWGGALIIGAWVDLDQQRDLGSEAPIQSENYLGVTYKLTDKLTAGLRANFGFATKVENLSAATRAAASPDSGFQERSPSLTLKYAPGLTLAGSDKISFTAHLVPFIDKFSYKTKNASLRFDTSLDWTFNPKVSAGVYLSQRTTMYDSLNDAAVYRLITAPSATYSFNDNTNMYVATTLDNRSRTIGYGKLQSEKGNTMSPELGANFTVGKVTLNPATVHTIDLNTGKYIGKEIDLNVTAVF